MLLGPKRSTWIKLDIVQSVQPLEEINPGRMVDFERSLVGIAFEQPSGIVLLPEELVAHSLVDSRRRIQLDNLRRYLRQRFGIAENQVLSGPGPLKIRRFTTESFFYDGQQVFRLYRGHRLPGRISKHQLLESARQGGAYLSRSVDSEGRFVYNYLPKTNRESSKYNMVRHAGTIYSMLDLYETTGDRKVRVAAERAIRFMLEFVKPYGPEEDDAAVLAARGKIKLGGVALAVVALAKHYQVTQDGRYRNVLRQLGHYIQQSQFEDGRFLHQRSDPGGEPLSFISQYYPGEALLALVRLYAVDHEASWLDTAEKGAHYLIGVRDRDRATGDLIHDHWLLYALNELFRYRSDPLYLNHSLRIAQAITGSQNRNPAFPDYLGSYYRPPRSTPTATRTEGLIAAYQLAHDFGRKKDAQRIWETIRLGIAFQLQTQFRPESVLYLQDPQRSLGAFHRSLTNFSIRIDYVQHNLSALVALYRILEAEGRDKLGQERPAGGEEKKTSRLSVRKETSAASGI
jgi:hypothetical protein